MAAPGKKRILVISDSETLLSTRKLILQEARFEVASACGFEQASKACGHRPRFDLLVLGHTLDLEKKTSLVLIFRQHSSSPIVSTRRSNEPLLPQTEWTVDSLAGPEALIEVVNRALGTDAKSAFSS